MHSDTRSSTAATARNAGEHGTGRTVRRMFLVVLAVAVLADAAGLFGVRSSSTTASAGGYSLSVTYPLVARAGLDAPWRVTVRHDGGFDDDIVIAVSARYFDIFETQGFHPQPDSETSDGDLVYLTFAAPPAGSVFSADFDAYIQPASQLGREAQTVLIVGGQRLVGVKYRTWLMP